VRRLDSRGLFSIAALALASAPAQAFGDAGHRIAGTIAERFLCEPAAAEVARLGEGASLAELGWWADGIRSQTGWEFTAPWHYINVLDSESLRVDRASAGDDILWAIEHFSRRLADDALSERQRALALKFLTHFVVDLHQPLHVGRESDRGGNLVEVILNGQITNLHRLWDSRLLAAGPVP
jgi:hypothetical protein